MAKRQPPYHSVYTDPQPAQPCDRAVLGDSTVFVHDLMSGPLPAEYDSCDLLYAELPWRAGFRAYNDRAGIDGRTYPEFMAAVASIVVDHGGPLVLVTGLHAGAYLPKPAQAVPLIMPVLKQQALAYLFNLTISARPGTTLELLDYLAGAYKRVGDFCCGYGHSLRAFTLAGGTFVGSDFNPLCVGYVAENAGTWK